MDVKIITIIIICLLLLPVFAILLSIVEMDRKEQYKKAKQTYACQHHGKMTLFFEPPGIHDFKPTDPYIHPQFGETLLILKPCFIKFISIGLVMLALSVFLLYYCFNLKLSILGIIMGLFGILCLLSLRRRVYFFHTGLAHYKIFTKSTLKYQNIIHTDLKYTNYGEAKYWSLNLFLHNGKVVSLTSTAFAKLQQKSAFWQQYLIWHSHEDL